MSNIDDYTKNLKAINALNSRDVKKVNIPVGIFIQEGENLINWCKTDKEILISKGLQWSVVANLSSFLGALREAQSRWITKRNSIEEISRLWKEKALLANDMRNTLLHDFRFAFRQRSNLLSIISEIAKNKRRAHMIQDLNDLALLGKQNPEALKEINFDVKFLDKAADSSDELGALLAKVNSKRSDSDAAKIIRDKAYTLCKNVIDEIRTCGRYAFWRNKERLKGYASQYMRHRKSTSKLKKQVGEISSETEKLI